MNLMPYPFYKKLSRLDLKLIRMGIHLANNKVTFPRGTVEIFLVKIEKFVFPTDFVVLDMEDYNQVPIILGRPFLSSARDLVDVRESKLTLHIGSDAITFGVDQAMKHSKIGDDSVF